MVIHYLVISVVYLAADVFRLKGYFKLPCYGLLHAPDNKDILCDRILHCLVIAKIEIDIIDKKLLLHG